MDIQYTGNISIIQVGKLWHMDIPLKQALHCDRAGTTLRGLSQGHGGQRMGSHPQEQTWSLNKNHSPAPEPSKLTTADFQSCCRLWSPLPTLSLLGWRCPKELNHRNTAH